MNKLEKRIYKLKGFLSYLYSLALLRYSSLNEKQLKKYFNENPVDRLHVGCGLTILPGWCNVLYERNQEYGQVKAVNGGSYLNYNLLKSWPWPEGSINYVAGAHFIEHIDLNHCLAFAKEAFTVLKPGGVIRLSCPDLEIYARNYVSNNEDFFKNEHIQKACVFKEAQTPSQIFAAKAYDSGGAHKWFHDFSSLKSVLERAGFSNVRKLTRLEGKVPDLEKLELPNREIESLYIEATKP